MSDKSAIEKLAEAYSPEIEGTALLKLAAAYGQEESEFDGGAIMKIAEAYSLMDDEEEYIAISKLASVYGFEDLDAEPSAIEKVAFFMKKKEPPRPKRLPSALAGLAGVGAGGAAVANKDAIMSKKDSVLDYLMSLLGKMKSGKAAGGPSVAEKAKEIAASRPAAPESRPSMKQMISDHLDLPKYKPSSHHTESSLPIDEEMRRAPDISAEKLKEIGKMIVKGKFVGL